MSNQHAERRRQIWREYGCDRTAYKSLRAMSGQNSEPVRPFEDEPQDLERLIHELQSRFRSSTTENLSAISNFRPATGETPERMFARFNLLARPLEDERPRVMTADQLKTSYLFHLREIRSSSQISILSSPRSRTQPRHRGCGTRSQIAGNASSHTTRNPRSRAAAGQGTGH